MSAVLALELTVEELDAEVGGAVGAVVAVAEGDDSGEEGCHDSGLKITPST